MNLIYVCSPYRGDIQRNVENVKKYCRRVMCHYAVPVAPHLFFTQFLNDDDWYDRTRGLEMGLALLPYCKEIWVIADEVSEGMIKEIKVAKELGLKFSFKNSDMEDIDYDALIINKRIGPGLREIIKDINNTSRGNKNASEKELTKSGETGRRKGEFRKFLRWFFTGK